MSISAAPPRRRVFWAGLSAVAVLAGGCATPPEDPEERAEFVELNDPLEPTNRAVFEFNRVLDRFLVRPLAQGYRAVLPVGVRRSVHNFLDNASAPYILANDLLQGEGRRAGTTASRFVINTAIGFFGAFDPAAANGLPYHGEDFGQTFAVWGIPEGPYLMLPLFGPSSPRDTAGLALEMAFEPVDRLLMAYDLTEWTYGRLGTSVLDQRSAVLDDLDKLERSSIDFYAAIRSLYRQTRAQAIENGR